MYCPTCGNADQKADSYCRQCGRYLIDPDASSTSKKQSPRDQFTISLVFDLLSAIVGVSMAIALIAVFASRPDTPKVIYAAITMFFVIAGWQIASFFNNLKLKKRFTGQEREEETRAIAKGRETKELPEAKQDFVPASVTERTTRNLSAVERSSKPKQ